MCFNATNLQIAMLRALNIPCRYAVVMVKRESAKGLIPDWRYKKINDLTEHVFGEIFINGRWMHTKIVRGEVID